METERRRIAAIMLCLILPLAIAFASGEKEGKSQAAMETVLTAKGQILFYDTVADYQKQTGKTIAQFSESPMLAQLVQAGKLPPVENRLPKEPMVIKPLNEVGRFGGVLRTFALGPTDGSLDTWFARVQHLLRIASDFQTVVPNMAKGWVLSQDMKSLTLYLREGARWSDGEPFTADDILFWCEDIILNDELTPAKPKAWSPGGELVKISKVDDYTVRFRFAVPYPPIIVMMSFGYGGDAFAPKHYLKQFHIKYNDGAQDIAKKEGYDNWYQCLQFHNLRGAQQLDASNPCIDTYALKREDTYGNRYYDRNAYFYKVDTAGNQLPYIDELARLLVENVDVRDMKTIAGDFDIAGFRMSLENYTVYKEGEAKGNYRVDLWSSARDEVALAFNYTHKDPLLRQIFNDIRFRQAMSLAINRDEINKSLFFGKGIPRQQTLVPYSKFYQDWMAKYYAEYDPAKANKLLDEMGLKKDADGFRLRPDGKRLEIIIDNWSAGQSRGKVVQLVKEYWDDVGVRTNLKDMPGSLYGQRGLANERDVGYWCTDPSDDLGTFVNPKTFRPPWQYGNGLAYPWWQWYSTDGQAGEEPPRDIKNLYSMIEEWQKTRPGSDEYKQKGQEIFDTNVRQLWQIGTVGMAPWPFIVSNKLKNLGTTGYWCGQPYHHFAPSQPEQWYFSE